MKHKKSGSIVIMVMIVMSLLMLISALTFSRIGQMHDFAVAHTQAVVQRQLSQSLFEYALDVVQKKIEQLKIEDQFKVIISFQEYQGEIQLAKRIDGVLVRTILKKDARELASCSAHVVQTAEKKLIVESFQS
jgi:ABC-type lipoprotein release transport system permease subunit